MSNRHHIAGVKLHFLPGTGLGYPAGRCGKVNMRMPLLVAPPGMDDAEAARQKAAAPAGFQDNVCREAAHLRQVPAVMVYQGPELTGYGEGDVLSFPVGDEGQQVLYPGFPGLHAAVGAGAASTTEADFFA